MTTKQTQITVQKRERFTDGLYRAAHETCPEELWTIYRTHRHIFIYEALARNTASPTALLERLAQPHLYERWLQKVKDSHIGYRKDYSVQELNALKKKRGVIFTEKLIVVPYAYKPTIKHKYDILLAIAKNKSSTTEALHSVYSVPALWKTTPTRKDVSATAQLELLTALNNHPNKPADYNTSENQDSVALMIAERRDIQEEKRYMRENHSPVVVSPVVQSHSTPQHAVIKTVAMSFADEMEAEFMSEFN